MPDAQRTGPWRIGFLILAVAVILWIGYAVTVPRLAMSWEKSNQFGGMFGGIGALFSGLALAGVVVAVLMQKEELELQREELAATREELKRSTEAQTASSQALTIQVEVMQLTARLNALASLLDFYERHKGAQFPNNLGFPQPASDLAQETMHEVRDILKRVREETDQR